MRNVCNQPGMPGAGSDARIASKKCKAATDSTDVFFEICGKAFYFRATSHEAVAGGHNLRAGKIPHVPGLLFLFDFLNVFLDFS
jgi:hypothetical protein